MKYSVFAPVLLAASGLAFAQEPAMPQGTGKEVTTKHKVEVVSADITAKTITVVKATGKPESKPTTGGTDKGTPAPVTLKVEDAAASSLSTVKTGDAVTITCRKSVGPAAGMPEKENPGTRDLQHCEAVTSIMK
jgi:hypothetical protein